MKTAVAALALLAALPFATAASAQNSEAQAEGRATTEKGRLSTGELAADPMVTNSTTSSMPNVVPSETDDDGGILVPGSGATFFTPKAQEGDSQEEVITDDQQPDADPQQ